MWQNATCQTPLWPLANSERGYLISAPGDELTKEPTVNFSRLSGLRLVLPRRPSHWRNALDEAARSLGFALVPVAEVDSLTAGGLVAHTPGLYSMMGPYSIAEELQRGRLQASKLVKPDPSGRAQASSTLYRQALDLARDRGHQIAEAAAQSAADPHMPTRLAAIRHLLSCCEYRLPSA